jgi:hypothetical protein
LQRMCWRHSTVASRVYSSDVRVDVSSPITAGYKTQSAFNL